jgi:hypothetical protein
MIDKIDYYDILSTVILGTIFLCSILVCFPGLSTAVIPSFPEAFSVIALSAIALFLGHLVQAVASLLEPLLFWTFGGRPSDRALATGLGRYFPVDSAVRIKKKLKATVGNNASDFSLFLFAIQFTDSAGVGRASRFNGQYAYHRGLVILLLLMMLLFLASSVWGRAATWSPGQIGVTLAGLFLLLLLMWYRTKQRAFYYVREVLLTAERVVAENHPSSAP